MRRYISVIILITFLFSCKNKTQQISDETRIVSLAPSLTRIIIDLGLIDSLKGVTEHCRYPEFDLAERISKGEIRVVSGFNSFDYERILAINPTKVLVMDSVSREVYNTLMIAVGEDRIVSFKHPATLIDIYEQINIVGAMFSKWETAESIIKESKLSLNSIIELNDAERPSVVIEIYNSPYMIAGSNTFLAEMVRLSGGKLAFDINDDWVSISMETLVTVDPDVIIKTHPTPEDEQLEIGLRAYREGRIYIPQDIDNFLQPGLHTTNEILKLNRYFYNLRRIGNE